MVEVKDHEEPAFHPKRKPDLSCVKDKEDDSKKQKLDISDNNSSVVEDELDADEGESDSDEDDGEEDSGSEEGDDSGQSDDQAEVVDRKGKGILVEDKGKGKLIAEEEHEDEDDDDDDSSNGAAQSDDDSDLSEDPLAEVDLDNILPTRTRRRVVQPGVYLANDLPEEDSDDSDA